MKIYYRKGTRNLQFAIKRAWLEITKNIAKLQPVAYESQNVQQSKCPGNYNQDEDRNSSASVYS